MIQNSIDLFLMAFQTRHMRALSSLKYLRKKSQGSNSGDGGNTGNGGKIVCGVIGARGGGIGDSLLVASYACMTFIYGSSWKGKMVSEAERSLDKSSEGLEEVFPVRLGNSPVKPEYSQEYL
ncbi:hypothetical protein Tco_1537495 [Tanacetum coccineum]